MSTKIWETFQDIEREGLGELGVWGTLGVEVHIAKKGKKLIMFSVDNVEGGREGWDGFAPYTLKEKMQENCF